MRLRLAAPRGTSYWVEAETGGFGAGRVLKSGGRYGIEWCRRAETEQVRVTVRRRAGSGPFAVRMTYPG